MADGQDRATSWSVGAAALHAAGLWRALPDGGALVWLGRRRRAYRVEDPGRLARLLALRAGVTALLLPLVGWLILGRSWLGPTLGPTSWLIYLLPFALMWLGERRLVAGCPRDDAPLPRGYLGTPRLSSFVVLFAATAVLIALRSSFDDPSLQAAFRLDERSLEAWLGAFLGMGALGCIVGLGHAAGVFGSPPRPIFDPALSCPGYLPMPDGGAVVAGTWPLRPVRLPDRTTVLAWAEALVLKRQTLRVTYLPLVLGAALGPSGPSAFGPSSLVVPALLLVWGAVAYGPVWRIWRMGRCDPEATARLPPGPVAFDRAGGFPLSLLAVAVAGAGLGLIPVTWSPSVQAALVLPERGVAALFSGALLGLALGFAWGMRTYGHHAGPARNGARPSTVARVPVP